MASPLSESKGLIAELITANSYREFLLHYFVNSKGYASFARKAGIASRSYPRDVAKGKKRLAPASLPKFIRALGLRGYAKTYFTLLVMLEEQAVNTGNIPRQKLLEDLSKVRSRIKSLDSCASIPDVEKVFGRECWPDLYAALGTQEMGATIAEVSSRCGLRLDACIAALNAMASAGLVTYDETKLRYIPRQPHLIFNETGSGTSYKEYFLRTVEKIGKSASARFDADDRLFFTSALSVRRAELPLLKRELRQVLLRFVDEVEEPGGDCIIRIGVGLVPIRYGQA